MDLSSFLDDGGWVLVAILIPALYLLVAASIRHSPEPIPVGKIKHKYRIVKRSKLKKLKEKNEQDQESL